MATLNPALLLCPGANPVFSYVSGMTIKIVRPTGRIIPEPGFVDRFANVIPIDTYCLVRRVLRFGDHEWTLYALPTMTYAEACQQIETIIAETFCRLFGHRWV